MLSRLAGASLNALRAESARLERSAVETAKLGRAEPRSIAESAPLLLAPVAKPESAAPPHAIPLGNSEVPNADLAAMTVDRITSLQSFEANVAAIHAQDEATQTLLNIKA